MRRRRPRELPRGAGDPYDGFDQDCDGLDLDDLDGDGDAAIVAGGTDCDDGDATIYGGAPDLPLDSVDSNCDGIDGVDADGDGFAGVTDAGGLPPILLPLLDCDDADPDLNLADADADGSTTCAGDCDDADPAVEGLDADGDGTSTCDGDCNDADANTTVGSPELCDGIDQDCDGVPNANDPGDEGDADGDSFLECEECDDSDPANFPGNIEGEDGTDNDCDGLVDGADSNYFPEMVFVPRGSFTMGCGPTDSGCATDEEPPHEVELPAFWIDTYEVTLGDYMNDCVTPGICATPDFAPLCNHSGTPQRAGHPVNCIPWQQAVNHCGQVGKELPTEAMWEKAARGTDQRLFPWGDSPTANCSMAHLIGTTSPGGPGCGTYLTAEVGSYPTDVSPYGALDMGGNVAEWVADWYGEDYYANSPAYHPTGPDTGTLRVNRGGHVFTAVGGARSGHRGGSTNPSATHPRIGFRCAIVPVP